MNANPSSAEGQPQEEVAEEIAQHVYRSEANTVGDMPVTDNQNEEPYTADEAEDTPSNEYGSVALDVNDEGNQAIAVQEEVGSPDSAPRHARPTDNRSAQQEQLED